MPFLAVACGAGAALLYMGRSMTFWLDEWRAITFEGGGVDFLRPVNQHWSTVPLLLYRGTFEVVELHSYLPYLAQVVALHLVAVTGAYVLMRRRIGRFYAILLALPLLLLGAGGENLFWAYQTGFVGSVAFGTWALVLIETSGRTALVTSALLLVAAVMSSGVGLFFVVAVLARTLVEDGYRIRGIACAPSVASYLIWYLTLGRDSAFDVADPPAVALFAIRGSGHSFEALLGFDRLLPGGLVGPVAFAALCVLAAGSVLRGRPRGLAIGCLLGIVSMYASIGLVRAEFGGEYAGQSRYAYGAVILLVLAMADLLPALCAWLRRHARTRVLVVGLLVASLAWSIAVNLQGLDTFRDAFQYRADLTRSFVDVATAELGEDWVDPESGLELMPPARDLVPFVGRHGSPTVDTLLPGVARTPPIAVRERALLILVGDRFRAVPASVEGAPMHVRVRAADGAVVTQPSSSCLRVRGSAVSDVRFAVAHAARLRVAAKERQSVGVLLGYRLAPTRRTQFDVGPGADIDVLVPPPVDGQPWQLALQLEPDSELTLCARHARTGSRA